ncbi:MAG: hypothetical protein AAGA76_04140 [Pseudomonadota bacterium]
MIYSIAAISIGVCSLACILVFQFRRLEREFLGQTKLIRRALHTSLGQSSSTNKKLDAIMLHAHERSVFQKKSAEHNRVLLASLNRQLQRIETMIDPHSTAEAGVNKQHARDAENGTSSSRLSASTAQRAIPQKKTVLSSIGGNNGNSVVKLEDIFADRGRLIAPSTLTHVDKSAGETMKNPIDTIREVRRASNG